MCIDVIRLIVTIISLRIIEIGHNFYIVNIFLMLAML